MNNQMREQFEAHWIEEGYPENGLDADSNGNYYEPMVRRMWKTWQAALAASQTCVAKPELPVKTWEERRAEWFKRNAQKRNGPDSYDQFMLAEIADLRAALSASQADLIEMQPGGALHQPILRIDLHGGSYLEWERKTDGGSGWLLRDKEGRLRAALCQREVLLIDAALAASASSQPHDGQQAAMAVPVACATCNGTRLVDDGEIDHYPNGEPFACGPVKCAKDCPDCVSAPSQPQQEAVPAAPQPSQVKPDLHSAIMNIPVSLDLRIPSDASQMLAYKLGHRDARHAAAELVAIHGADASQPKPE